MRCRVLLGGFDRFCSIGGFERSERFGILGFWWT
jgi:hypothetical protein